MKANDGRHRLERAAAVLLPAIVLIALSARDGWAQSAPLIDWEGLKDPDNVVTVLKVVFFLTALSLAPALLIMLTSFTRIIVVFSFLRSALGLQQMPPNQLVIGLSLFLSFFIMTPVWKNIDASAVEPYIQEEIDSATALERGLGPLRDFMLRQTREKDISLFLSVAQVDAPATPDEVPTYVLIPAFMINELRIAFQIGFILYIPFLVIDMVVASVLMSMGMFMLPPIVISLPFKVLLFVIVDGWYLIVQSMVESFR
jgi:flagellar biosynthetic protein FliP